MAATTGKIKRSLVQTFLDITPSAAATWKLLGQGVSAGKISYNPKTTEETYIDEDSATKTIDSYAPTMPVEQVAIGGDSVFDYIDNLRVTRAVLSAAETHIMNVWLYEDGGDTAYPAETQDVSIQIEDFGGEGGSPARISYTINYMGDPTAGTCDLSTPSTPAFT